MRNIMGADVLAGGLFIILGGSFLVLALDFGFGSLLRMGPGFFPIVLSSLLIVIGLAVVARGLANHETLQWPKIGPHARVILAMIAFAGLMQPLGSYLTMPVVVVMAASASPAFRWRSAIALAVFLTIACDLIFRIALGLPLHGIGPWIGG
ncbi:tripartite tricarboxylate transporter TctB family protein [Pseudorhizobium endolithicum]|uniref:Tripartite tricarboxylate transporter TctB family protein n=1 Tax=Pseudorhizobium endolithicum TaxID=1191678 RepID=A0ABN7JSF7_9HYPH|nr:tripartite tricarboxylate transporter TctB family protein [Pseudorhizobium endolithicum]CAD7037510.1 tripartite tricarboxylate transporter TctB family protein [Pseudorhizobium endolithicum]